MKKALDPLDIVGKQFNRLTIVSFVKYYISPKTGIRGGAIYLCKCRCGIEKEMGRQGIVNGTVKSCGCYLAEKFAKIIYKHGMSRHPLRTTWVKMIFRCNSKKCDNYHNYGGRGISVCKEWVNNFDLFYQWSIANGWAKGLQIDRINNDGNYEPNNCRWVTKKVNLRNTRVNFMIKHNGEERCLVEWCEIYNLNYRMAYRRLVRDKKSFEYCIKNKNNDKRRCNLPIG